MRSWEYFHNIELAKKLTLIAYIFITIPFVYSGIAQYQVGFFLYFVHAGVENQLNLE